MTSAFAHAEPSGAAHWCGSPPSTSQVSFDVDHLLPQGGWLFQLAPQSAPPAFQTSHCFETQEEEW